MKDVIARKAAELFNQYSVKSVTMDEIATRLGISKKTLYIWYTDKNELVETVYLSPLKLAEKECLNRVATARDAIYEAFQCWRSLRGVLELMTESLLHDLQKYHYPVFEQYERFKKHFLYQLIYKNIERGKTEQLYRSDIEPEIIASHEIAILDISQSSFLSNSRKWPASIVGEQIMLMYLHGLGNSKGLKLIPKYQIEFAEEVRKSESS